MSNELLVLCIGVVIGAATVLMIVKGIGSVTKTENVRLRREVVELRAALVIPRAPMPRQQRKDLNKVRLGLALLAHQMDDDTNPRMELGGLDAVPEP